MSSTMLVVTLCIIIPGIIGQRIFPRILNGLRVPSDEFPHQVFLRLKSLSYCGGAIIDENHILTSAYCLYDESNSPLKKKDVEVFTRTKTSHKYGDSYKISEIRIHEKFFTGDMSFNIAMLRLAKRIKFNDVVKPVNLPTTDISKEGSRVIASGFGELLGRGRKVPAFSLRFDQIVISDEKCVRYWGKIFKPDDHFCAQNVVGAGPSGGDNGNAVIVDGSIVGINSVSSKRGSTFPNVYIRVYKYLKWIKRGLNSKY